MNSDKWNMPSTGDIFLFVAKPVIVVPCHIENTAIEHEF